MNLIKQIDTGPLHADPIVVCVLLKAEFQGKRSAVFFVFFSVLYNIFENEINEIEWLEK